jgi:hypothetical protein
VTLHLCIIAEGLRTSVHLDMAKAMAALGHRVDTPGVVERAWEYYSLAAVQRPLGG